MVDQIEIGTNLENKMPLLVDVEKVIMGRTFLTAITRYGKSWCARRLVEQLYGKSAIVVIDPEGEYSSLREKYVFMILGQDVPIELETVQLAVDRILERNLSSIVDLSLIDEEYGKKYVSEFIKQFLFRETKLRNPCLIVVEEADQFAPERGVATSTCLEAMKNLAKKGGKRGIGALFATQRPAFVSKMVLSQCTTLKLIGRIEWPSDLEAVRDFLQINTEILRATEDQNKPHIDRLNPGEFFVSGSAIEKDAFIKVGSVQTSHLGATPQLSISPKIRNSDVENVVNEIRKLSANLRPSNQKDIESSEKTLLKPTLGQRDSELQNLASNSNPYVYQAYSLLEKDAEEPSLHGFFSEDELALLLRLQRDSDQFKAVLAELDKYPSLIERTKRGIRMKKLD